MDADKGRASARPRTMGIMSNGNRRALLTSLVFGDGCDRCASLSRELDRVHQERAELLAAIEAVCFATKAALDDVDQKQHMFEPQRRRLANAYATIVAVRKGAVR